MELLPIFKTSLILFMLVMTAVLTVSYVMYKIKNLNKQEALKAKLNSNPESRSVAHQIIVPVAQQEQYRNVQYRVDQQKLRVQEQAKPKDRFQIVNEQQVALRIYQTEAVAIDAPYYHPRNAENKRQFLSRKPFNLFDSYSSGGEKLHKLSLSQSA